MIALRLGHNLLLCLGIISHGMLRKESQKLGVRHLSTYAGCFNSTHLLNHIHSISGFGQSFGQRIPGPS